MPRLRRWFPEDTKRLVLLASTVGARQNEWFTLDPASSKEQLLARTAGTSLVFPNRKG
jgi:hypothetical protein